MGMSARTVLRVFVFPILTVLAVLVATQPTWAASSNCAGYQGWHTPGTPSTFGQFGAYLQVMSNYDTTTDCDGYATKNAVTGAYQTYPTSQTGDSHNTHYDYGPDAQGNPRFTYSEAESQMLANDASGWVLIETDGTIKNWTRTEDTLKCSVPTAGSAR